MSRSAIKAIGLTAGRFKSGALRGYYLTWGWYLNKKHALHNREGYISVLTYPASWHGFRPVQWIKTATPDHFQAKEDQVKDILHLILNVSGRAGINKTKHHPSILRVLNKPCCGHQAVVNAFEYNDKAAWLIPYKMGNVTWCHRFLMFATHSFKQMCCTFSYSGDCQHLSMVLENIVICSRWEVLMERQMENRSCQLMELIKIKYHEPPDTSRLTKYTIAPSGNNYITADSKSLCRWRVFVRIHLCWRLPFLIEKFSKRFLSEND